VPVGTGPTGHIASAQSIPIERLAAAISQLPADVEVVAYCRGPYCVSLTTPCDSYAAVDTEPDASRTASPNGNGRRCLSRSLLPRESRDGGRLTCQQSNKTSSPIASTKMIGRATPTPTASRFVAQACRRAIDSTLASLRVE
jgi:hypothetical protein